MQDNYKYIPLHIHSDYSILDGLQSVKAIVKRAAQLKIPALALTDISNICGFIKFYSECRNNGIKPILGADIAVFDGEIEFNITLLAIDRVGKQNLYDILSNAWLRSDAGAFNAKTNLEELANYSQGLILLDGFRGDIAKYIASNEVEKIDKRLDFYKKYFSNDRFCFEITRTNRQGESEFENFALNLCIKHGIPPVASNDTVFLYGENDIGDDGFSDYEIHDVRVSIQQGVQRGQKENAIRYSKEQYLKSQDEMYELFSDIPEALENTRYIAERCNVEIELDHPRLPHYPTGNLSPAECLRQKSYEGLEKRLNFLFPDEKEREANRQKYFDRLDVELDVIINMDFPGYFLIVMEFIQWSKDHGVAVGPGRGSGGGSLVAYSLSITDFDPLRFDLLFERFLNPERVSMPDFDVDFCQRNREKTLDHVRDTYGKNAVSQIATFGTMAPKAAIKDTGRALGMSYGSVDFVAKMLPAQPGLTFKAAMGIDKKGNPCEPAAPDFVNLYNNALKNDEKDRIDLIRIALRLEGVIRNIGKHAAGVVISPTRTAEFTPLMLDSDGNSITQFDKKDVEHAGLVKFDFLGLTTLTIIQDAIDMINAKKVRHKQPLVDIHAVPYEDEASFKVIQECHTTAVFQLESPGMRKLIGQMKPDRFDDLIALVALYRPGPIKSGMVEHFVKRKHGTEEVSYPHPDFQDLDLKPILDSTYGVIVYQEQVMQIAQVLAGYSLGGADILRRAMGKKNPAEMAGQRSVFKDGAIKKNKDPDIAMKIFDQVEMFAEYGFNKSHSAAYALVAWWTLWLKTHYPSEFLAAMMTADRQRTEKLVTYINECTRLNIKVMPPDVAICRYEFTVKDDGTVIYGLGAVKGIGEEIVRGIINEREKEPFIDFFDFVKKLIKYKINKRSLEALITAGALDKLGSDRATMFASISKALEFAQNEEKNNISGQTDLFASFFETTTTQNFGPTYIKAEPWSDKYQLNLEKNVLGLYLTGHPFNTYKKEVAFLKVDDISSIKPVAGINRQTYRFCGLVLNYNKRVSQSGTNYFELTVDDTTSQISFLLFREYATQFEQMLERRAEIDKQAKKDNDQYIPPHIVVYVEANAHLADDGTPNIRVRKFFNFEEKRIENASSITINIEKGKEQLLNQIDIVLKRNKFNFNKYNRGITFNLFVDNTYIILNESSELFVATDDLVDSLRDVFGADNITINYGQRHINSFDY